MLFKPVIASLITSVVLGRSPYQVLNIRESASEADIKAAYRKLAKKYHPDKNPNDPEAQRRFIEISNAYEQLTTKTEEEPSGAHHQQHTHPRHHHQHHQYQRGSPEEDFRRYQAMYEELFRRMHEEQRFFQFSQKPSLPHFSFQYPNNHRGGPSYHHFYTQHSSPRHSPVTLFLLNAYHRYPSVFIFFSVFVLYLFYSMLSLAFSILFSAQRPFRSTHERSSAYQDAGREKLPTWSPQLYRKGIIAIIGEKSQEQRFLELRRKFSNDPLQFFIFKGERVGVNDVIAVSRGGTKWTMKPGDLDLESWLLKLMGGEVRWSVQEEERCPIRYEAR